MDVAQISVEAKAQHIAWLIRQNAAHGIKRGAEFYTTDPRVIARVRAIVAKEKR